MTISRWKRGVDEPEFENRCLLHTRLGIPIELWRLCPEQADPARVPAVAVQAATVAPVAVVAPTKPPKAPESPHEEGPTRRAGEGFRAAVERREEWRAEWQAAWLADWHRAHPGVPRDLTAGGF